MWSQAHVTVMVANMDRAWDFYTQVMGLEAGDRWGDDYAVVKGPGMEIGLHPGREDACTSDGFTLSFGTADIDATVAALKQRGLAFATPIMDDGPQRSIDCVDPDGNPIHIREDWTP